MHCEPGLYLWQWALVIGGSMGVGVFIAFYINTYRDSALDWGRLRDCETSLNIFDEGRVSEYWMRHGN